jgi:hypothetical protein
VVSDVSIGAGRASVLDRGSDGVDVAYANVAEPGSTAPQLHLDGDVGLGYFEVVRGDEPLHHRFSPDESSPACPA